jgi:LacI family transcriptional regulator
VNKRKTHDEDMRKHSKIFEKEIHMATIKDIARMTGYSIGTVSRVINHQKDVSAKARAEIEKAVRQTGYVPNANAKLLKQGYASAVTVVIKGTSNIFLNAMLERVQKELYRNNEEVNVVFVNEADDEVKTAISLNKDNHPKGIIFLGADLDNFRRGFSVIKTPSVMLAANGSQLGFANLSSFCTDDYAGGYRAASELIRRGHRRIAVIGGFDAREEEQASAARLKGAMNACKDLGIPFDLKKQYIHSIFSLAGGYQAVDEMFAKVPDVSAVFALSDLIAIGAMRAIHEKGLSVPKDISIIGFDGITYSSFTNPRLMSVQQDIDRLAHDGVEDLLKRIEAPCDPVHVKVPFHMIHEESIGPVRKEKKA